MLHTTLHIIALWRQCKAGSVYSFVLATQQMCWTIFGFKRYDSVTHMLMENGLQSFNTAFSNSHHRFNDNWFYCSNLLVKQLHLLQLLYYVRT